MTVRDDNQAHIYALADQLEKVQRELVAALEDLKAQYKIGDALDFTRLDSVASALATLDDIPVIAPTNIKG